MTSMFSTADSPSLHSSPQTLSALDLVDLLRGADKTCLVSVEGDRVRMDYTFQFVHESPVPYEVYIHPRDNDKIELEFSTFKKLFDNSADMLEYLKRFHEYLKRLQNNQLGVLQETLPTLADEDDLEDL